MRFVVSGHGARDERNNLDKVRPCELAKPTFVIHSLVTTFNKIRNLPSKT